MGKYNIKIETINTESAPYTAEGEIDGIEFEARTIHYNGGLIWKIVEQGMCPAPTTMSQFTRGQRSAVAAWLKKCESNAELLNVSSQTVGATQSGPSKAQQWKDEKEAMTAQIEELRAMVLALQVLNQADEDEG